MIRHLYWYEHPELGNIERVVVKPRPVGKKFRFSRKEIKALYPEPENNIDKVAFFSTTKFQIEKIEPWADPEFMKGRELVYHYFKISE